jgi:hypothetical protein
MMYVVNVSYYITSNFTIYTGHSELIGWAGHTSQRRRQEIYSEFWWRNLLEDRNADGS